MRIFFGVAPYFALVLLILGIGFVFLRESRINIVSKIKKSKINEGAKPELRERLRRLALKSQIKAFDREIFSSLVTLNNLAIVMRKRPLSQDKILEYLKDGAVKLKPIYQKTLSILRSKTPDEAFEYFEKRIPTRRGANFASLLRKLDRINPAELGEQIYMMKETIAIENQTEAAKEAVSNGNITMAVSTIPVLLLIINFAYVVVLQDVFQMLSKIF